MKARWLIGVGLSIFLAAPFVLAQEPAGDASGDKVQKQEKKQDQTKAQEQLKKQEKQQAQEQKRNRHRHRKGKAEGQGEAQANGSGGSDNQGSTGSSEPTVNPADDTQLVDADGDGIDDKVQSQNKGDKGDGEKGAMKRGQHRYRHRNAVGTGNGPGEGKKSRAGKGFGGGFVDANGDGVCDNQPKGSGNK